MTIARLRAFIPDQTKSVSAAPEAVVGANLKCFHRLAGLYSERQIGRCWTAYEADIVTAEIIVAGFQEHRPARGQCVLNAGTYRPTRCSVGRHT